MANGIEGLDGLMKKFGSLAEAAASRNMEKAVGASVKTVQASAKLLCPVNDGELRGSIRTRVEETDGRTVGTVYTNKKYAQYVEFGTGPKGEASHDGISPEVNPVYSQSPWWIHESQVDAKTAETYRWFYIDTPEGRFYQSSGQAAQPFLYPALRNNEKRVTRNIANYLSREIRKACE